MVRYHPDHFEPRALRHCAERASTVIAAGYELIAEHSECSTRSGRKPAGGGRSDL